MLDYVGFNHLWTIAPEIKYYILVPILCYIMSRFERYWLPAWFTIAILTFVYEINFNIINNYKGDKYLEFVHNLWCIISMFLSGSLMAMMYYNLENRDLLANLRNNQKIQQIISLTLVFMFLYGFRIFSWMWQDQNYEILEKYRFFISGIYWSIFVFLMLIGSPNYVTDLFSQSSFLKKCGKYSFGMYLLHPMCMNIVTSYTGWIWAKKAYDKNYITGIEKLGASILLSYFAGYLFFIIIEDNLIRFANKICKHVEQIHFFRIIRS